MTISGTIYGVVLNDRAELDLLEPDFHREPYCKPPQAPVVYIKPGSCLARGRTPIRGGSSITAAATLALLFARDARNCDSQTAMAHVGAMALALDLSYPRKDYYRPAVAQQNGDGFLALGDWACPALPEEIHTSCDRHQVHSWSLQRLQRDPATLIAALSSFMTLCAGDVLLVGLPGNAPQAMAGQELAITARGLPALNVSLAEAQS